MLLGVRHQTLYAYVSRGLIHNVTQQGRKERLYSRADINKLYDRASARAGHGPVAAAAMNWGEPIIATAVTEITARGPSYRGHLAVDLASAKATFESVAELLWHGRWDPHAGPWPLSRIAARPGTVLPALGAMRGNGDLIEVLAAATVVAGLSRDSVVQRIESAPIFSVAEEIIQVMVGLSGFAGHRAAYFRMRDGQTIVGALIESLAILPSEENVEALGAILTLLADHELSPGTLVARVCASSESSVHSAVAAAVCASSGATTGRLHEAIHEFFRCADNAGLLIERKKQWQARGIAVPGFGHPLYPQGDPRANHLLTLVHGRAEQTMEMRAAYEFIDQHCTDEGVFPRHELALSMLVEAMGLPMHFSTFLFALARTVGWIAHIHEQKAKGFLLRPRARFVGQHQD